MNFTDFVEDGFVINQQRSDINDLAVLSLRISIKSYFSTYNVMKYTFSGLRNEIEPNYFSEYYECYCDAIVHFQHFVELAIKQVLRNEHELLALNANDKPVLLYKLLKQEPLTDNDYEKLHSIEFSESLKRLQALIKEGKIADSNLRVYITYADVLSRLNNLRNRIWHRGAFIVRYKALDQLFIRYLLPLAIDIISHPNYSNVQKFWMYPSLKCGIDPIKELIIEGESNGYNICKVALLKELGRASYSNPIIQVPGFEDLADSDKKKFEGRAKSEKLNGDVDDVCKCPVCGCDTLVVYKEVEEQFLGVPDTQEEICTGMIEYTWQAVCTCCSFEITNDLGNPSDYGMTKIRDLWYERISLQIRLLNALKRIS